MAENDHVRLEGVENLRKVKMSKWSVAFLIFCFSCGGGFGIEAMIPSSGPGMTILMLIVLPIIWALPLCLTVSELSALMPCEGGMYVWAREALGEMWGFFIGWWGVISCYLGQAAFVILTVGYAEKFIPMTPTQEIIVKVGMIVIFTIVNLLGLKEISIVSTVLSILVICAFALVAIVGFANWHFNPIVPFMPQDSSVIDTLGGSICIAIWLYCGYASVTFLAGEIENPEVIPKGFKIALPIIALVYLLPTIAGLSSVGQWEKWGLEGPGAVGFADVLINHAGPIWGVVFIIVAIIAQVSAFNAYIAAGSRGFFVLADDYLSPRILVKLNKRGVPHVPIILLAIVTIILMNLDFTTIIIITTPVGVVSYFLMQLSLIILRKKYPVEERKAPYYIKGSMKVVYLVGYLPIVIGIIALLVNGTEYFLLGFISIISGVIAYIVFKIIYGGLYNKDPEKYPINKKTRLAVGDIYRIGAFIALNGIYALGGSFFLKWYEGKWGPEYYLTTYGSGIMSNFDLMIRIAAYGGIIAIIAGGIIFILGKKYDKSDKFKDAGAKPL